MGRGKLKVIVQVLPRLERHTNDESATVVPKVAQCYYSASAARLSFSSLLCKHRHIKDPHAPDLTAHAVLPHD